VDQDEYRGMITNLMDFLQGRSDQILSDLERRMYDASDAMHFEGAARLRDQLQALQHIVQRQKVVSPLDVNQDVIAFAREDNDACVQIFFIRSGKIVGRDHYVLEGTADEDTEEIVTEFVKQFYEKATDVPGEVLLPHEVEEAVVIEQWLQSKRGNKVALKVPRRGQKRELLRLAAENAGETLAMLRAQWQADTHKQENALTELQDALNLPEAPARIECFDVSTTQGTAITASRVVFVHGVPRKSDYRRFNIRTVSGKPDDYASMKEALDRRFRRWADSQNKDALAPGQKVDPAWSVLPDLLVIDGGKGQLGVALEVLEHYDLKGRVPVIGLAKQQEEIFVPGRSRSILLARRSQGLYLLQRVRDEAHRFAITSHRVRRTKMGVASQIDAIPGIGPKRRKALLARFGSIEGIRGASLADLAALPGIGPELAEVIKSEL
jgi:excinuclease ABC subunit C